jgi:hypothetical protein
MTRSIITICSEHLTQSKITDALQLMAIRNTFMNLNPEPSLEPSSLPKGRLLMDEMPLQLLPTLATKVGLNEAIVLQQMHYWLTSSHNKNFINNRHWVYNSYEGWHQQFPFWSKETIKRTIYSLEKQKLILSCKLREQRLDHRKWYTSITKH